MVDCQRITDLHVDCDVLEHDVLNVLYDCTLIGIHRDIGECNVLDRSFGQTDEITSLVAGYPSHMVDVDVAQMRCLWGDGFTLARFLGLWILVIQVYGNGGLCNVLHLNVGESEIAQNVAAVSGRLNANCLIAAIKCTVPNQDMLNSAVGFASHRNSVTVEASAIL